MNAFAFRTVGNRSSKTVFMGEPRPLDGGGAPTRRTRTWEPSRETR